MVRAAMRPTGPAPVVSKGELVEIGLQVLRLDGTAVCAKQPAFQQ